MSAKLYSINYAFYTYSASLSIAVLRCSSGWSKPFRSFGFPSRYHIYSRIFLRVLILQSPFILLPPSAFHFLILDSTVLTRIQLGYLTESRRVMLTY